MSKKKPEPEEPRDNQEFDMNELPAASETADTDPLPPSLAEEPAPGEPPFEMDAATRGRLVRVGELVLYRSASDEEIPAIVCRVVGDGVVNIRAFGDGPVVSWVQGVAYGFGHGQWHWAD